MKLFCFLLLMLNSSIVFALNSKTSSGFVYPSLQIFVNHKDGYRTEMECHEKSGMVIECSFMNLFVRHLNTEQSEKFLLSLKTGDDRYIEELLKQKDRQKNGPSCKNIHKEDVTSEELNWDKELCEELMKAQNRAELIKVYEKILERDKQTCIVSHLESSEEFRFDPTKSRWIDEVIGSESVNLIDNVCGLMAITYLEKDPRKEYSEFSWNLVAISMISKKDQSVAGSKCSLLDNTAQGGEISYGVGSGQYGTSKPMSCKYIDFSEL